MQISRGKRDEAREMGGGGNRNRENGKQITEIKKRGKNKRIVLYLLKTKVLHPMHTKGCYPNTLVHMYSTSLTH